MSLRTRSLGLAAGSVLLLLAQPLDGAHADRHGGGGPHRDPSDSRLYADPDYGPDLASRDGQESVMGLDGNAYPLAPHVVGGRDGMLFYGPDFDMACHFGRKLDNALDKLAALARIIQHSGRRVVFTVAPNKSMVENAFIHHSQLPQGACDSTGLREQAKVLDTFQDPNYLALRKALVTNDVLPYFRTDPHWSTIGGSVYSARLAALLDPHVAKAQRYVSTAQTIIGLLSPDLVPETVPAVQPGPAITVRTALGSVDWTGLPATVTDYSWVSTPVRKTVPGHTLLFGDSFTQYALGTLRPVFRQGRFLWIDHFEDRAGAEAIKDADTVVIEIAQFVVQHSSIGTKRFRHVVRHALRHHRIQPAIDGRTTQDPPTATAEPTSQ